MVPFVGQGFAQDQVAEDGDDVVAVGAEGQDLLERGVGEGHLEVGGEDAAAVGDDRGVVGGGHRRDLAGFGDAADPGQVRLEDIDALAGDQLAEAVAGRFVLAGGEALPGAGGFDPGVAVVVVRWERLLDPADPVGAERLGQGDRVGDVKAM